ncbi:MAG: deoxyribose-phosphate aldolase [Actinobacteria bacterium]|nr:deoxyribose-phosphate aldolase [Actinomycetota bacterium]
MEKQHEEILRDLNVVGIAKLIDHTILAQDASCEAIEKLCTEARDFDFCAVCVNSCWTKFCRELLTGSGVLVATTVGFPLGAMATHAKAKEAEICVKDGADEIDMVMNVGTIKSKDYEKVKSDIIEVVRASSGKLVKVILENCLLTDEEKLIACKISVEAGAHYVKTSTGFSTGGATVKDVELMRQAVGSKVGVKAAGGIRNLETLLKMVSAGATRIGTSSGVSIIKDAIGYFVSLAFTGLER